MAAISTVIISGDWEGSLLFHDIESKANVVSVEKAHPGGVTAVTVFSSNDDEGLFAGSTHTHARACAHAFLKRVYSLNGSGQILQALDTLGRSSQCGPP